MIKTPKCSECKYCKNIGKLLLDIAQLTERLVEHATIVFVMI